MRMLFAQRIRIARVENGLLQKQLAIALDIDIPMYSRIERGDRRAKKEQVILLSDILHIEEDPNIADKALKMIVDNRKIWK